MDRATKIEFVSKFRQDASLATSLLLVDCKGLTVAESTEFRNILRNNNATLKVVKNKLAKIALTDGKFDPISKAFTGQIAVICSTDPVSIAKTFSNFAKQNNKLKFVAGMIDNQVVDAKTVETIASLPSLDELRAKIIGLLNAPASKIVGVLQAPASKVARVVSAHATKNN